MNKIIPLYKHETRDKFLITPNTPAEVVEIDGKQFLTGYLKSATIINLISIGQTDSLLESGHCDLTDYIDPVIELDSITYRVNGVFMAMSTRGDGSALAIAPAVGGWRTLVINFKNNDVGVIGTINLETGETIVDEYSIDGSVITDFGFKLDARYANSNRLPLEMTSA